MAAALIGSIEPFDASANDWETSLEQYLDANSIRKEEKAGTLLTLIGGPTYQLVRNLVAPANPKAKSFDELTAALTQHFAPAPLAIAERYRFHKRDQAPGETMATYVAELLRMARYCDFGGNLNISLRDRFVCGLKNEAVIKKLLLEKDLDLPKAIAIETATKTASRDTTELGKGSTTAAPVHSIRKQRPLPKTSSSPSRDHCF